MEHKTLFTNLIHKTYPKAAVKDFICNQFLVVHNNINNTVMF